MPPVVMLQLLLYFFKDFIYLRERESEYEREEGQREREKQTPS